MSRKVDIVCLKCGRRRIDDGRNPWLIILGLLLLTACVYAYLSSLALPVDSSSVLPTTQPASASVIIGCCVGLVVFVQGLQPRERVKCLDCGNVWTPPRDLTARHIRNNPSRNQRK